MLQLASSEVTVTKSKDMKLKNTKQGTGNELNNN